MTDIFAQVTCPVCDRILETIPHRIDPLSRRELTPIIVKEAADLMRRHVDLEHGGSEERV